MNQSLTNGIVPYQLRMTLFSIDRLNLPIVRTQVREMQDSLRGLFGTPAESYVGILDGSQGIPYKVVLTIVVRQPADNPYPRCADILSAMVVDRTLYDREEVEPGSEGEMEIMEKLRNRFVDGEYGIIL